VAERLQVVGLHGDQRWRLTVHGPDGLQQFQALLVVSIQLEQQDVRTAPGELEHGFAAVDR